MVPVEEALRSGELLLNTEPALVEETVRSVSIVEPALVSLFTLLLIIFMRNFINILPYIIDSFTRARSWTPCLTTGPVSPAITTVTSIRPV